jgi:hypothetical protein
MPAPAMTFRKEDGTIITLQQALNTRLIGLGPTALDTGGDQSKVFVRGNLVSIDNLLADGVINSAAWCYLWNPGEVKQNLSYVG